MMSPWTRTSSWVVVVIAGIVAVTPACALAQSALDPAGPHAARIERLWWLFLITCTLIWALVLGALFYAVFRRRPEERDEPMAPHNPGSFRRASVVISGATAISLLILGVFLAADFMTGRALHELDHSPDAMPIKVTGHQWWWDIEYDNADPTKIVRSSNEIHIPVGRPIQFQLDSADVIHSFWIPNLHGKRDLIPGKPTTFTLMADRAGTFEGTCGEFCGYQHAQMGLSLTAEPEEQFKAWFEAQRTPARDAHTEGQKAGRQYFMSTTCAMCHTISGTTAASRVGPDLTHIASRPTLGAGALANTRENLALWVTDPQHVKPGVLMPSQVIKEDDLRNLLDYLQSLE